MSTYNINISGDGTNSTPPTASPSDLAFQKSDSDSVHFKNNTSFEVVISFNAASVFNPQQLQLAPNSASNVSIIESSEEGNYYYDIHYEGMPVSANKPSIYLSSSPVLGGNPTGGPTGAVEH